MPLYLLGRLLILSRWFGSFWFAFGALFLFFGGWGVVDDGLGSVGALVALFAIPAFAVAIVWVGKRRVVWLFSPWRHVRFRDVVHFEGEAGQGIYAVLADGRKRYLATHAGWMFERRATGERRIRKLVEILESRREAWERRELGARSLRPVQPTSKPPH